MNKFKSNFLDEVGTSVRKIPKNHIHVTGRHAAQKSEGDADFESMLEAEHLLLLDHETRVKKYLVQPLRVPVPGVTRGYVPDVLVEFHPDEDGVIAPSELREVKSTLDLQINGAKYVPKFEAARQYCAQRGWSFRIVTELDIRTPRLSNVKFVRAYEFHQPPQDMVTDVLQRLTALGLTDSAALLNSLSSDEEEAQLQWVPVLWHLVAVRKIAVDWDVAFGSVVPLWPMGSCDE